MSKNISDFVSAIDDIINRFDSGEFEELYYKTVIPLQENDYIQIADSCIEQFYLSYLPSMYRRTYDLYNAYHIDTEECGVDIEYGSQFMNHGHRVDEVNSEYIFDNSFINGWHGGARLNGARAPKVPVRRTSSKNTIYDGPANAPWKDGKWTWAPAKRSKSPRKSIDEEIKKYVDGKSNASGSTAAERAKESLYSVISRFEIYNFLRR